MEVEFGSALIVALLITWRFCRCSHHWELVDKTEFKPPVEDIRGGMEYCVSDLRWLLSRTAILVLRCDKCGASQVLREKNT